MEIKTARLLLRPYEDSDFPHLFKLQSDPEIMRFIRPAETAEGPARARIESWKMYAAEHPGYGVWVVENLDPPGFAGYAILRHADWKPGNDIEVGYTISKAYWGKGYAPEVTLALLAYARESMKVPMVVAFTHPDNHSSNRVLEKCGFTWVGMQHTHNGEGKRWEIHFSK